MRIDGDFLKVHTLVEDFVVLSYPSPSPSRMGFVEYFSWRLLDHPGPSCISNYLKNRPIIRKRRATSQCTVHLLQFRTRKFTHNHTCQKRQKPICLKSLRTCHCNASGNIYTKYSSTSYQRVSNCLLSPFTLRVWQRSLNAHYPFSFFSLSHEKLRRK